MKKILLLMIFPFLLMSCNFTKNLKTENNNIWNAKNITNTWIIETNNTWNIKNITNTWNNIWYWDVLKKESQKENIEWISLSWADKETEEAIEEINEILKWL